MLGLVEIAIRKWFPHNERLYTPAKKRPFEIVISQNTAKDNLPLLFGERRTLTLIPWECLEGIPDFLKGKDWVAIGTKYDVEDDPMTLGFGYGVYFLKKVRRKIPKKANLALLDFRTV